MYRYMIRTDDGQLLFQDATSIEEAAKLLKLEMSDIRRHMPVKYLDAPKMSEEVKQRLRAIAEERRSLRRVRPSKKEDGMSEGTVDALKAFRAKDDKKTAPKKDAAKPSAEAQEEKTVKTSAKKKAVKKAAPKSGVRKAKVVESAKPREGFLTDEKVHDICKALIEKDKEISPSKAWETMREKHGRFAWPKFKPIFEKCGGALGDRCK